MALTTIRQKKFIPTQRKEQRRQGHRQFNEDKLKEAKQDPETRGTTKQSGANLWQNNRQIDKMHHKIE